MNSKVKQSNFTTTHHTNRRTYTDINTSQHNSLPTYHLRWKKSQLWVRSINKNRLNLYQMPVFSNQELLVSVLQKSFVETVHIDSQIGEDAIKFWIEACQKANKKVRLNFCSANINLKVRRRLTWQAKRILDYVFAIFLLLLLSPIMGIISVLIFLIYHDSILSKRWKVGHRGKLFQVYSFRISKFEAVKSQHQVFNEQTISYEYEGNVKGLGRWLYKYNLVNLPQLFNVLKSEMSLIGLPPLEIHEALQICPEKRMRLNALPGLLSTRQIYIKSNISTLQEIINYDLHYLNHWCLSSDLMYLFMFITNFTSRFKTQ